MVHHKYGAMRIEHLEAVYALAYIYIASLYYYPVLCEHGQKGGCCAPLPPFGENTGTNGRVGLLGSHSDPLIDVYLS